MNAQTFTKGTALTYACENGHTEVAEILIQHGAELVSRIKIIFHRFAQDCSLKYIT